MQNPNDVFTLKLTAAIVIDGEIATAGEIVELSRREAQNILGRGLAELHGDQPGMDSEAPSRHDELDAMTVNDLKAFAEANGHDLGDSTKKADIIAAILAAEQVE